MNPGSPAPQASVLIQPRLRAPSDTGLQKEIKSIPLDAERTIINTVTALRNNGRTETTVKQANYKLREIARNCNINDPEEVKGYIATARNQKTGAPLGEETKNKLCYIYDKYCEAQKIVWKKPFYKVEEKTPLIPSTENINIILNNATKRYTVIFQLLIELGAEGHELEKVTQADIDAEQGIIRLRGCKGHASGTYKLKERTAEMLRAYLHKNPQEHPFPTSKIMGDVWRETRRRGAKKLCKPELDKIPLKSLRNYSGAQFYYKLPDPIAVMRHLRHKKLETTMHYLRGITLGDEEEEYICKTASNVKEATDLIEHGFQYVTEIDGLKLFKKRK